MSYANGPKIVTNGLVLHLDAANSKSYSGSGTTWYDLSGNNKNFVWSSSPSFTDGAIPYFSTLNKSCNGPASNSFGIDNTSGYTIFVICMQNALTQAGSFNFRGTGYASRGIFAHLTWSNNIVYFDQGGCCGADTRTNVSSGGSQTWNVWAFRRLKNSSTRTIFKNGNPLITNTSAAANINLTSSGVIINEYSWDARLQVFSAYNRDLSDTEILQNYNALKGRFGL